MRKLMVLSLLAFGTAGAVEIYLAPRYEVWEEYDEFEGGRWLLTEKGTKYAFGIRGKGELFLGGGEIYGGTLGYDGQTMAGDPVKTDTSYFGFSLYGGIGKDITSFLRGEASYRLESWTRDIKSTETAIGYKERWFFHSLDLKGILSKSFGDWGAYLFLLYRFTLGARMQADIEGIPELEPKRGLAYEVGGGISKGRFGMELSYSYLEFRQSEPKQVDVFLVYQPRSVRETYSLSLSLGF